MKIKRIIEHLEVGVLSKVNLGGNATAGVTSYNYPELISAIEMGINELSQIFNLRQRELIIKQENHIKLYELDSYYAQSNTASAAPYKYINDTPENPFKDDVLKIEAVYDELGREIRLNDMTDPESIYTPSLTSIQILNPNENNSISVIYSAACAELVKKGNNLLDQDVYLPSVLLNALTLFVAAQVVLSKDSLEAKNESMAFMNRYKEAVALAMNYGAKVIDNTVSVKLESNKWV